MNTFYSLHNSTTHIVLWTTNKFDEIVKYIDGEDLSNFYIDVAENDNKHKYSGKEFMSKYKRENVIY